MINRKINLDRGRQGITLVEVIVTLVILAGLAAIVIPSTTAYVDKAKEQKYILEARRVSDGVQYYVLEKYAEGNLNKNAISALLTYPLDDSNHPLTELLEGAYSEGARIVSVVVKQKTGEYLNFIYEVEGYTIEFDIIDGTITIED